MNMDNDFGFSFEDETDDKTYELLSVQDKHKKQLEDVETLILPLLDGLMKDPDKPMIKWKNRVDVVSKLKDRLLTITRQ